MDNIINCILARHSDLFGADAFAKRINIGFTNVIYSVDDKFIVKICTKESKEAGFLKETEFYCAHNDMDCIPHLYFCDTTKSAMPYCYEILEKLEGVPLYNVWHTFNDEQRRNIIRQLCEFLKKLHSFPAPAYDWTEYNKSIFTPLFEKAKADRLFTDEEISLLEKCCSLFDNYLPSDNFVMVHNDLHFDNIIYHNGKIKLIDFERSLPAPCDFELDILWRMVRKPWKFANGDIEQFTHPDQYKDIMGYIEEFYPQLVSHPYLHQRLGIYDMIYFLRQYVSAPQYEDLKEAVLQACLLVVA